MEGASNKNPVVAMLFDAEGWNWKGVAVVVMAGEPGAVGVFFAISCSALGAPKVKGTGGGSEAVDELRGAWLNEKRGANVEGAVVADSDAGEGTNEVGVEDGSAKREAGCGSEVC